VSLDGKRAGEIIGRKYLDAGCSPLRAFFRALRDGLRIFRGRCLWCGGPPLRRRIMPKVDGPVYDLPGLWCREHDPRWRVSVPQGLQPPGQPR
jgi:hypothetical protein